MGSEGFPLLPISILMERPVVTKRKKELVRLRADSGQHRRIMVLMALFGVAAFLPTAVGLYGLMVRDHAYYSGLALGNQTRTTMVAPSRGTIYDRNMEILACAQGVEHVYLDPHELKQSGADIQELSQELGRILQKDPQWIAAQAGDISMRYKQIAAGIELAVGTQIREYINESGVSGIHLEPSARRYYPFGTLAAQLIGFTNSSGTGVEGIEAAYDKFLSGTAGKVITTKGNNEMDMPYSYERYADSVPGCDVVLTLDATVQECLEKQMQSAIDRYAVQNGAFGLVMEVKTGAILAMATLGSYDPNNYLEIADPQALAQLEEIKQKAQLLPEGETRDAAMKAYREALTAAQTKQWRNRVLSDGYEPGSTFKVLTMAAALDSGSITLNTSFHCGGAEQIPGRSQLLHCWKSAGHGSQQTPQALQNSCNLAFAHIALKMGGDTFYDYIQRFGILEKTGIDLYGESKGVFFDKSLVTDTQKWGTASLTSGSFGQTFKITPLQLVRGISAVVNGGKLMEPYVVSEVIDHNGKTVLRQEPVVVRQVISEATSKTMCQLLRGVVTEGTAKNASVAGFSIGGKTGTSEKIDVFDENGQRVLDKIVSFVGVAPMENPEYIVLVALDTPSRETGLYISGGVMAAPTVGAVMADILPYLGVERSFSQEELAGKTIVLEDMTGWDRETAQKHLKEAGLGCQIIGQADAVTGQIPAPGQSISGGSEVLLYFGDSPPEREVTVPDFHGMTRQQASDAAGKLGLYILVSGNPSVEPGVTVAAQEIPAGTAVIVGTTVKLEFIDTKGASL